MSTQTMLGDIVMTDLWENLSPLYDRPMWDEVSELEDFSYWEVVSDKFVHSNGAVPPALPCASTNDPNGKSPS
jgi:hypothetical protein